MKNCLYYLAASALGLVLSTTLSANVHPAPYVTYPAPEAAPLDTLPQGRHQVSSFRNGSSTEFIVEHGEIQYLKIDGQEIPAAEYDQYREQVEGMLGSGRGGPNANGMFFEVFEDLEMTEESAERIERYFEERGEEWEKMGERFAERIEDMFDFDRDGGTFRFHFDGGEDGVIEFDLDSLLRAHPRHFSEDEETYDLERMAREKEQMEDSNERQIEELETMIEQLERRKRVAERRLEAEAGERGNDVQLNGFSFRTAIEKLRLEGLIPDEIVTDVQASSKRLKINKRKASDAAHDRFLELYREKTGKRVKFDVDQSNINW